MDAIAQSEFFEFPVIAEKANHKGIFGDYMRATREHGQLATVAMIAAAMGVSKQRAHFLIKEGRLATVTVGDKHYVPLAAFELFLTEERKAGRKFNDPSLLSLVRSLVEK